MSARARTPGRRPMTPDDPRHGTYGGYVAGCGEECCQEARRVYLAGLRERRAAEAAIEERKARTPLYQMISPPGAWSEHAACASHPTDVWFPANPKVGRAGGKSASYMAQATEAKRICAACPVIDECRTYIEAHPQPGIWAGLTEDDRKTTRRTA